MKCSPNKLRWWASLQRNGNRTLGAQIVIAIALLFTSQVPALPAQIVGGVPLWTNVGPPFIGGIAVDNNGTIFITGDSTIAYANTGAALWTNNHPGRATAIAVDRTGKVFVAGLSTFAYSSDGIPLWTNRLPNSVVGWDRAIAVDRSGNLFVSGYGVTVAYSGLGLPLWTNKYVPAADVSAVATDNLGNVFVTGGSFTTIAYSGNGKLLWTNTYRTRTIDFPGSPDTGATAIAVDKTGNVFATGFAFGSPPSAYATLAYSGQGVPLWTNLYSGPERGGAPMRRSATALAVDRSGNVIVTGRSEAQYGDYAFGTIAYSSGGIPLWTNQYREPGMSGYPVAIAVDSSGNAFVAGSQSPPVPFSFPVTCATVAYSGDGTPLWTNRYGLLGGEASLTGIAVDNRGNVFVTGTAGNYPYHSFTIKYSSSVPPNLPPIVACRAASISECGTPIKATAFVSDPDGDALGVFWTVNGLLVQTNLVPANNSGFPSDASLVADLPLGINTVTVLVSDSATNTASCSTAVTVVDTIPPVIVSAIASPSILWPPNHDMVPVNVRAHVTDSCGPTVWKIIDVRSNESVNGRGGGNTGFDWLITGDHTLKLRAERSGNGAGRIYTVVVQATDASGNSSETATVEITVPKSEGHAK